MIYVIERKELLFTQYNCHFRDKSIHRLYFTTVLFVNNSFN